MQGLKPPGFGALLSNPGAAVLRGSGAYSPARKKRQAFLWIGERSETSLTFYLNLPTAKFFLASGCWCIIYQWPDSGSQYAQNGLVYLIFCNPARTVLGHRL
jgi:hypothetical protein